MKQSVPMPAEMIARPPGEPAAGPTMPKSKGEKLFDWVVYGGVAGVVTFVATLWLAGKVMVAKSPAELEKIGGFERTVRDFMKRHAQKKAPTSAAQTTILMQGGNLMVLPVALAEHYKEPLVRRMNEALGDPTPVSSIEQKPKQTLWSLVEGRLVAWGAVFGTLYGASKLFENTLKTFEQEFGVRIAKLFGKPLTTKELVMINGELRPLETKTFQYGKIAALDVFASAAAASILYVGGHFFAKRHEEKKERTIEAIEARVIARVAAGEPTVVTPPAALSPVPESTIRGAKHHTGPLSAPPVQPPLHV